jgi:hypothetical protein
MLENELKKCQTALEQASNNKISKSLEAEN